MGLPSKRRSRSSKRERASHFALSSISLTVCAHCHKPIRPHRVCPYCGWYKGREVIHLTSKTEKRARKTKKGKKSEAQEKPKEKDSPEKAE